MLTAASEDRAQTFSMILMELIVAILVLYL